MTNLTEKNKRKGRTSKKPSRVSKTYRFNRNLPELLEKAAKELSAQSPKSVSSSDVLNDSIEYYLDVRGIKL